MIQWNNVTWYSQVIAILLGLVIFSIGFKLGTLSSNQEAEIDDSRGIAKSAPVEVSSPDGTQDNELVDVYERFCADINNNNRDDKNACRSLGTCSLDYNGEISKNCWAEDRVVLDEMVEFLYNNLTKDLKAYVEKQMSERGWTIGPAEQTLEYLVQQHEQWYMMRDTECELQAINYYGGTLSRQLVDACKVSTSKTYLKSLLTIRDDVLTP